MNLVVVQYSVHKQKIHDFYVLDGNMWRVIVYLQRVYVQQLAKFSWNNTTKKIEWYIAENEGR